MSSTSVADVIARVASVGLEADGIAGRLEAERGSMTSVMERIQRTFGDQGNATGATMSCSAASGDVLGAAGALRTLRADTESAIARMRA